MYPIGIFLPHRNLDRNINRLSVVRDVSGKSRVIGITNYWIQVTLHPLHLGIFRFLRDVPNDGTFDQLKPIKNQFSNQMDYLHSFDLTAATDRLPVDLQGDIIRTMIDDAYADS
jgi:hypothetical protein